MELLSNSEQIVGLLAILSTGTSAFVRVISWITGQKRDRVRIGLELFGFFSVTYLFVGSSLAFFNLANIRQDTEAVIAFFWWLALAFTLNAAIRRFIWFGALGAAEDSKVPKLLRDAIALVIYGLAIMIVMHFVYDEPIAALLATSGAVAFIVGISAQSTLREVFAGLSLNTTGALRIGDYVEINNIYGRVSDISWRSI